MSKWYYNKNLKPIGPIDFDELKKKIMRGEIRPSELISKDDGGWKSAWEFSEIPQNLYPANQTDYFKEFDANEKAWILLIFEGETRRQEGPLSATEIVAKVESGQSHLEDYVWRSGMTGWVQIGDRPELQALRPGQEDPSVDPVSL